MICEEFWISQTDQFYELCRANPEIKFERNRRGDLVIMSPTGGETGNRNSEILIEFGLQYLLDFSYF